MRKQIFTAIADKLLTVPGITHVDLWNDNGAHFAGGAVYPLPAVFIEFDTIEWHQLNNGARRADINVRLHVLDRATAGIHSAQDPAMAEALKRFDLLDAINAAMQGLRGDTSPASCTPSRQLTMPTLKLLKMLSASAPPHWI